MNRQYLGTILLLGSSLLLAANAKADSLPVAGFGFAADGTLATLVTTNGGTSTSTSCNSTGCETVSVTGSYSNGEASVSMTGTQTGTNPPPTNQVGGVVEYYFEVVGPANVEVPLTFTGAGSSSVSGTNALLNSFVQDNNSGQILLETCADTPGTFSTGCASENATDGAFDGAPQSFSGTAPFSLESNTLDSFNVEADGFMTSSGASSFDPSLTIDPNFADASEFTLEFSPNVVNTPEPSTLALSLFGFLALAVLARRRWATR